MGGSKDGKRKARKKQNLAAIINGPALKRGIGRHPPSCVEVVELMAKRSKSLLKSSGFKLSKITFQGMSTNQILMLIIGNSATKRAAQMIRSATACCSIVEGRPEASELKG